MCPDCQQPLAILELQGIELDYCFDCRGTWLDSGELEWLLEITGSTPEKLLPWLRPVATGITGRRRCVRCRRKLQLMKLPAPPGINQPLQIDRCPHGDGLWLDRGELLQLVQMFGDRQDADFLPVVNFLQGLYRHQLSEKGADQ
ncbi:MAG: hypothetical protein HJJLKODD_00436 [Phycisphaerae bacterium]|nr:hypothetical protein [Phycisphaerae bacterium]